MWRYKNSSLFNEIAFRTCKFNNFIINNYVLWKKQKQYTSKTKIRCFLVYLFRTNIRLKHCNSQDFVN